MADLLGFTSIALVSLFTIFMALRLPDISRILYVALSLRILIIIIGHYFVPLPDSTKDAAGFESLAWTYGQDGFLSAIVLLDCIGASESRFSVIAQPLIIKRHRIRAVWRMDRTIRSFFIDMDG